MLRRLLAAAILVVVASPAVAHTGHAADGLVHGFLHPIGGYDHVLAMIAVGLWSAQIGGLALWLLPATFVSAMTFGAFLGVADLLLPSAELGIIASVVVLGIAIATAARLPLALSAATIMVLAVFHGYAHGTEMPLAANGVTYGAGFAAGTAVLHAAGLGVASLLRRTKLLRPLGGAIAVAGAALGIS